MEYVYVILVLSGMVEKIQRFDHNQARHAELLFIKLMSTYVVDFDSLTMDDIESFVEDGYVELNFAGQSSIQLHWSDT